MLCFTSLQPWFILLPQGLCGQDVLVFGQFLGHEQPVTSQLQQVLRCVHIFALTAVITVETWPLVCLRGGRETRTEDAVGEDSAWQRPPSFCLSPTATLSV